MIIISGQFRMPAQSREAALEAIAKVVIPTRSENGCLHYSYAEDVIEANLFRVTEVWESREALKAHFDQPHMKEWIETRGELGFSDRDLTLYEAGHSEKF